MIMEKVNLFSVGFLCVCGFLWNLGLFLALTYVLVC